MKKVLSILLILVPALIDASQQNKQITSHPANITPTEMGNPAQQQEHQPVAEQKNDNITICCNQSSAILCFLECCLGPCFCCCPERTGECFDTLTKQPQPTSRQNQ